MLAGALVGVAAGFAIRWGWDRRARPADPPPRPTPPAPATAPSVTIQFDAPASSRADPVEVDPPDLALSQRIILLVYAQGRVGSDEVAPIANCQTGMGRALGASQSSLAHVLSRLVSAGALEVHRGHVVGQPRRLKVYRLTALGESLARDLRRTGSGAVAGHAPPVAARSWEGLGR